MEKWSYEIPLENTEFKSINLWVQIRGIKPEMITKQNIHIAGSRVGDVVDIESKDELLSQYFQKARELVRMDINKPLTLGFPLKKKVALLCQEILSTRN